MRAEQVMDGAWGVAGVFLGRGMRCSLVLLKVFAAGLPRELGLLCLGTRYLYHRRRSQMRRPFFQVLCVFGEPPESTIQSWIFTQDLLLEFDLHPHKDLQNVPYY